MGPGAKLNERHVFELFNIMYLQYVFWGGEKRVGKERRDCYVRV